MTLLNFFFGSDSLYWEWFNWLHSWGLSSFIFTSHLLESKFKLPKKIACNDTKSKKVQFGEVELVADFSYCKVYSLFEHLVAYEY